MTRWEFIKGMAAAGLGAAVDQAGTCGRLVDCYAIPNVGLERLMPFQIFIWNGIDFHGRFMV